MMINEINIVLENIKKTLKNRNCNFIVSNREKNNIFCGEYSLSSKIIREIINNLSVYDFAKIINNKNDGYTDEKLYLFSPVLNLTNSFGVNKRIQLYLKINYKYTCNTIVIVSLHKCDYKLKYAFR